MVSARGSSRAGIASEKRTPCFAMLAFSFSGSQTIGTIQCTPVCTPQQAQNYEAERKAAEIRIRAERRAGELLKEMKANGERSSGSGDQKSESARVTPIRTLSDLGVTKNQSPSGRH